MKSKNMTLMAIAVGCGLVAALLTAKLTGGNTTEMVEVIVAKKELKQGTLLPAKEGEELDSMVGMAKFPAASLPPDVVVKYDDLKGKILNRTLKTNNFFSQGDVVADGGMKLPDGMYKYAVKTDGVRAVAGFVQPGDHVEFQLTETQQSGKVKAGFILRDVLVMAVDTRELRTPNGQAATQVQSVSLAVTSEQSLCLSAAERRGDVKLVLRDISNTDKKDVAPIDKLSGFDEKTATQEAGPAVETVSIVQAKNDVPANTLITKENFSDFFVMKEIRKEDAASQAVREASSLWNKYVTKSIDRDLPVFAGWFSDQKPEPPAVAKVEPAQPDPLEVLPHPREREKALYPRKFEQVINNQHFWFIETAPGEFRRADAPAAPNDLKDLQDSKGGMPENNGKVPEKKQDERPNDRPV